MENLPQNTTPSSSFQSRKNRSFFIAAAIEVVAFGIILFLFFAVLNYFNVFKIDNAFPFLSFLPHQPRSGFIKNKTNSANGMPIYQYDLAGGQQALNSYLSDMLLSSAMPSKNDGHMYASVVMQSWTVSNLKYAATGNYAFLNNSSKVDSIDVSFSVPINQLQGTLTPSIAQSFLQKVFKNLPNLNQLTCKSIARGGTLCENFTSGADIKSGYGAAFSNPPPGISSPPLFVLFSCRYYKGGLQFSSHSTSCASQ